MSRIPILSRLRIDPYIMTLLATVAVASLLPACGVLATGFTYATTITIGFLFFLYGARLSTRQAIDGLKHWRLHSVVLASTFLLFPLLGLAAKLLVPGVLTPGLYVGLMFLCCLPSTVQSSIAFTSIAKGNVACDEDRNRILNGRAPVSDCGGLVQRGGRRPAGSRWSCQRAKASMDGRL